MSEDKKWTRRAALGCLATGTGLFAAESAGYTAVNADRRSVLGTEDDPDALLGVTNTSETIEGETGESKILTTLTNRFDEQLDLMLDVINKPDWVNFPQTLGNLTNTKQIEIRLDCQETTQNDVEIEIIAFGNSQRVEIVRTFSVKCKVPECPVNVEDGTPGESIEPNGGSGQVVVNSSGVSGNISGNFDIKINNQAVSGDVTGNNILINPLSRIGGNIESSGDVTVKNKAIICGSISANGNITIKNNAEVKGNVTTQGDGDINISGTVGGAVTTQGDGDINISGTVGGAVTTQGDGEIDVSGTVEGQINGGGETTTDEPEQDEED